MEQRASETIIVENLVGALLGWSGLREVSFGDLGGSGAASRVEQEVKTISAYARRTLVIVDGEGLMAEYLRGAFARGTLNESDVLRFDDSLEASNASPAELIQLARAIARNPPDGRDPVDLRLDPEYLVACHASRRERSPKSKKPGLADTLIRLARRDEHGPVEIDKLAVVDALAAMLVRELESAEGDEAVAAIRERRPIVDFIFDRLVPAISRARPASSAV